MRNDYEFVDGTRLSSVIEALIFASEEPIPGSKIREIIVDNEEQIEITEETVSDFVDKLNERYDENGLSFRIQALGGGYTFVTQKKYHYWLSIFQHENAYRKLSQSAIESLAIVAYRQPITKPEVDQIRGVDSGYILRQLMEKALIEVSGRADSPGKPLLYRTTKHFLRHFGINSVDELPKPREIDEILKDDDMAEHRQLLMERQLMMEEMNDEDEEVTKEDVAEELLTEYQEKKAVRESEEHEEVEEEQAQPENENEERETNEEE
ncbi:SMC-Scp complex subunit ScpB [Gracilimonas sediminicola]|uniref:SMC-Scp complex subunit ScpB n=1 Tax=Gracilimonas sediminicola TaxID=2952158 RepID=A0A9X2RCG6_9BACT|nr:SMC-Scp complex subunit ScpB [Gracilimonas sediminicola]MCP9290786.1 SMC-Scp complex subunit ScpB [Gracilimonas sediminicola]